FTIWAVSEGIGLSMARTIRSVFWAVNPGSEKKSKKITGGVFRAFQCGRAYDLQAGLSVKFPVS
ncbi:hypothetical protein, partial [Pseudomonas coronafaciens]